MLDIFRFNLRQVAQKFYRIKKKSPHTRRLLHIYILMLTHLPCLNLMELNIYLENWSEKIPSHIPTIPMFNTDTRMYVTAVLMIVTLMIEEMRVYFTSPAALKHPP